MALIHRKGDKKKAREEPDERTHRHFPEPTYADEVEVEDKEVQDLLYNQADCDHERDVVATDGVVYIVCSNCGMKEVAGERKGDSDLLYDQADCNHENNVAVGTNGTIYVVCPDCGLMEAV